jgi:hypothetical protein
MNEDGQRMRMRARLWGQDHRASDTPEAVAQVLMRVLPGRRIILYPIVFDRSQAVTCHAALQALVRRWAEEPKLLARLCEMDPLTLPAPAGSTS